MDGTNARIVLTTCDNPHEATRLARTLVEERLAACATIIPRVESIYRWEGAIESGTETLLLLKTASAQVDALRDRLLALHSYQTPEFLVLDVAGGSAGYLAWLLASVGKA
ncbi:MAG: divalent-cation tolerance protein CutA [Terracidiphilus sp.]